MAGADRAKSLEAVMAQIEKAHGKGAVMRLGDEVRVPIDVIPTGSIALDVALGIGGLPRGRVVEIYGPESSGKTTVALHAVANAQKAGGIAAFIDAEHALDPDYAQKLGVDTDGLLVSQPDTGEQALEIADMLIRSGALRVGDRVQGDGGLAGGLRSVDLHHPSAGQAANAQGDVESDGASWDDLDRHPSLVPQAHDPVSYTHLRAHETGRNLVCRLLLE